MDAPTPTLFQLVYVSAATVLFTKPGLIELLEQSRRKNEPAGISGLLLYHEGDFMQLLEGDEAAVRATHTRIGKDPRHKHCLTLLSGPVAERTFPDWTMGFRDLGSAEVQALPGFSEFLNPSAGRQVLPTEPNRALRLLKVFRSGLR